MRLSKAKRLSKFLYLKSYAQHDYFLFCLESGVVFKKSNGSYHASREFQGARIVRTHPCAYELSKIIFEYLHYYSCSSFQKQLVGQVAMSNPLSDRVLHRLSQLEVQTSPLAGFRFNRPQILRKPKGTALVVENAITSACIPPSVMDVVGQYHHAGEEADLDLMAKGYTVLCEKPLQDAEFETFYEMFVRMAIDMPSTANPEVVPPLDACALMSQQQTNSSAGLLNLNTVYGSAVGSKKEMQGSAAAVNLAASLNELQTPGCLPYKPVGKSEVIKKGKKVRTIMIESQSNFMVLKHFFEGQVSRGRDIPSGSAIGISTLGGGFKTIVLGWLDVYLRHNEYVDWNGFLSWLECQTINESDKTAWESSTNEVDGLLFLINILVMCELPTDAVSVSLLSRALADYMCPAVQIDMAQVYFAPWRVASGSYFTAYGNTKRHGYMNSHCCDFIERHGGYGSKGCACVVCCNFGWGLEPGPRCTLFEIDLMRRGSILGDDYLAICAHPKLFNNLMDFIFKTETKTESKFFFSKADLDEPIGCEFLKKHFALDKSSAVWNVRTFRAPGRLLAKLLLGEARSQPERFKAACLSAIWECGANLDLHRILTGIFESLDAAGTVLGVDDWMNKYVKRSPALADASPLYCPTYADVLNSDGCVLRSLASVYWSRRCEQLKVKPSWY